MPVMARLGERQLVARLREWFRSTSPDVTLGIGDDAALLEGTGPHGAEAWASSVDACVQGVHFDLAYLSLEDVGFRAFQAAASDLAAMGARPVAALSALILPPHLSDADIERLASGQVQASRETECPIVGGNIAKGRELSVTTTVFGRCGQPLRRGGARPGDELWLVGRVGLAAAGLAWLRRAGGHPVSPAVAACLAAWRRPHALLSRGRELASIASAGIDVSDGLAADAWQLARASGVRVLIERRRLLRSLAPSLLVASRELGRSALRFALYGGEDYALLATGPSERRPPWAAAIGHVARGAGALLVGPGPARVLREGYDHRRGAPA